jgi:hypothetical protein
MLLQNNLKGMNICILFTVVIIIKNMFLQKEEERVKQAKVMYVCAIFGCIYVLVCLKHGGRFIRSAYLSSKQARTNKITRSSAWLVFLQSGSRPVSLRTEKTHTHRTATNRSRAWPHQHLASCSANVVCAKHSIMHADDAISPQY